MKKVIYIIFSILLVSVLATILVKGLSREDDWLCSNGEWVKHGNPSAAKPERSCGGKKTEIVPPADTAYIFATKPQPNEFISSPLTITGQARGSWYFEASFPIVLIDASGQEIARTVATAQGEWMTDDFVPFSAELPFVATTTAIGTLVLHNDNPSGLPENDKELRIPVYFKEAKKTSVKVFFGNSKLDPEVLDCSKVWPAERNIIATPAIGKSTIEELLTGPTEAEKKQGFFSSINDGVKIQSLTIESGLAKIDFDKKMEEGMGGSCRVSAIRAQINETLKQFASVKNVLISVDGRTEDILQP